MPICVTCAYYNKGSYLLLDPTDKEEQVMDGKVIVGMNKHREICSFQLTGTMLLLPEQVCLNISHWRFLAYPAYVTVILREEYTIADDCLPNLVIDSSPYSCFCGGPL